MKYALVTSAIILALTIAGLWANFIVRPSLEAVLKAPQEPHAEPADSLDDWRLLITAIALTESRFNSDVRGSAGDTGILQIREIYVNEVNRLYGTSYTIQDAYDPAKSLELFRLMQAHYNPSKDIAVGIWRHNKSSYYAAAVRQNMEFIRRYEEFRKLIIDTEL